MCAMQSLAKELHSEDVEVRVAAGEAIALLYHSCGISDLDSFLENDQSDESPPTSPVSHGLNSDCQASLGPAISAQYQPAALGSSCTPQGSGVDPPRGADDTAAPSSSVINEADTAQADVSEPLVRESESPSSRAAESDSDSRARRSEPASSEHAARDELSNTQPGSKSGDSMQVQAQQSHDSPQHAKQLLNDSSHDDGADHHTAQQQTETSNSQNAATVSADTMSNDQASRPQTRNQNSVVEVISNSQQDSKSKAGHQAGSKSGSRNPQQKAAAITNGLDDVVTRMRQLATNRGDKTRRSKKDRASTKATFRELYNVVEVCTPSLVSRRSKTAQCLCIGSLPYPPLSPPPPSPLSPPHPHQHQKLVRILFFFLFFTCVCVCVAARWCGFSDQDQAKVWRHSNSRHPSGHSPAECLSAVPSRGIPNPSAAESPSASGFQF